MRGGRIMKRLGVLSWLLVLVAPAVARVGVINFGPAYDFLQQRFERRNRTG